MSREQKLTIANLIRSNIGISKSHRSKLWMIASGAELYKRNNPNYYMTKERQNGSQTYRNINDKK